MARGWALRNCVRIGWKSSVYEDCGLSSVPSDVFTVVSPVSCGRRVHRRSRDGTRSRSLPAERGFVFGAREFSTDDRRREILPATPWREGGERGRSHPTYLFVHPPFIHSEACTRANVFKQGHAGGGLCFEAVFLTGRRIYLMMCCSDSSPRGRAVGVYHST